MKFLCACQRLAQSQKFRNPNSDSYVNDNPLEPKAFNVLLHLIRHCDQVVSKDDLIAEVWGGRIVSDTTLSSAVFAVRRALGDTGDAQNLIRTIQRRGFRFVAEELTQEAASETKLTRPAPNSSSSAEQTALPIAAILRGADNGTPTTLPRLAVLPFKNASANLNDYFCDGLTEDIISGLTHFSELRVIASGSSFRFKDRAITITEIAQCLDANYIVDGNVRADGGRLRIAVQLVNAATSLSIWADRYDREIGDIFAVQDAVTYMIAASLGVTLQSAELTRALRKRPSEPDAYDCLLHARQYTSTLDITMHATARDLLEQAVTLDPNYADAHALLANVYLAEHRFNANPRAKPIERALDMALKATRLDPQNAYAHCWLAIVHFFRKDNGKFEVEIQRALDLNPNDPEILAEAGHYLSMKGDFDRGFELSESAKALNPLHPGWYHFSAARFHYFEGKYDEMLVDVQLISMPNFYWTHMLDAAALGQLGRPEAKASLARMAQLNPRMSAVAEMERWNLAERDIDHMNEGLRKAGIAA